MFCKGDKVVYPLYGAGIIQDLEEKVIDGNKETYYVMFISVTNLKIMVSVANAENLGIRQVCKKDEAISIIKSANTILPDNSENWNQRYKENMKKIKSGKLNEVAAVYKSLMKREKIRSLSTAEKKMLTSAKQIILSEISLAENVENHEAEALLYESLRCECD